MCLSKYGTLLSLKEARGALQCVVDVSLGQSYATDGVKHLQNSKWGDTGIYLRCEVFDP